MDNLIKAKLLIELLDDRKYIILSKLSSEEIEKINAIDLANHAEDISSFDIQSTLNSFIGAVNDKKINEPPSNETESVDLPPEPAIIADEPEESSLISKNIPKLQKLHEKTLFQSQSAQAIACLLKKIDDSQKKYLMSKLSKEQKMNLSTLKLTLPLLWIKLSPF